MRSRILVSVRVKESFAHHIEEIIDITVDFLAKDFTRSQELRFESGKRVTCTPVVARSPTLLSLS